MTSLDGSAAPTGSRPRRRLIKAPTDPGKLLAITDICELFHLTPRAVRYYEQLGLIRPGRDRQNQRRYPAEARQRLAIIADLRRAHLSLATIQRVLEMPREEDRRVAIQAALRAELARLEAERRALRMTLRSLRPGDCPVAADKTSGAQATDCASKG